MKRMESLKPKPVSWNMERSLSWELWCLHHRKGMNSSVLLELIIIPNRVRYCILASRNQSSTTAHQANITLSSWSSKHDSPSALVFLSNFVQKLLLRHRPCVLWWIFFFTSGNVNTHLGPSLCYHCSTVYLFLNLNTSCEFQCSSGLVGWDDDIHAA